jgi:NAD-dependent dihydropyrimidine dehydrogenase PreA subunit
VHALRDRQGGRLPELSLQEFLIYILFFPALSAGPIDRSQRFVQDLRKSDKLSISEFLTGGKRMVHIIDQAKCIKCGTCLDKCPTKFSAIKKVSGETVEVPPEPVPLAAGAGTK